MHRLAVFALLWQLYTPLSAACPAFGVPTGGTGYDTATWTEVELDAAAIDALLQLNASRSFWVGYERGGFAWPEDVRDALHLTLYTADGEERWFEVLYAESTPSVYYALPFANTTPYADANGEHYGTHPCAAILMSEQEYRALIAALN